jgi:hypothetical protein
MHNNVGIKRDSRNDDERNLLVSGCALVLLAGIALAVDAPTKDGLWSIHSVNTMTRVGNAAPRTTEMTVSRCQAKGAAMQAPVNPLKADCKQISKSSNGSTRFFEMQCTQNGRTTRVKETVTMKGDNEAHTITDSTMDPPMGGLSGMKLVADWKYLGSCPAGVNPGDVVGPDGKVIHPPTR